MEVEISSNMKIFTLYLRGRETKSWDNIRGSHTFSEVGEWVLGEWRMRKTRSQ
jgi:hypothetical protein